MSAEFEKYKALKIKQLTNIYNINVSNLNIYYNNALNNIKRSKNTNANKNKLIQNLNNETNYKLQILKTQFNSDIVRINNLVMPEIKNTKSGDVLLLFYSGHGSYILDKNNNEKTEKDQLIVPCDFNGIIDDELKNIIQLNLKKDVTLIALFDCCHSGTILDLKYQYMDSLDKNNYTENANETETIGNVIMISGCSDIQTSSDAFLNNKNQGAMTWAFLQAFKSEKDITWRKLLIKMRDLLQKSSFSQIPQLSSGSFLNIDSPVFI
jgi:hypothetical protein